MQKGLRKRYVCLDHVMAGLSAMRAGETAAAEEHLSKAVTDPELDDALEDVDELQDAPEDEEAEEAAVSSDAPVEEASVKALVDSLAEMVVSKARASDPSFATGDAGAGFVKDLKAMIRLGFPETASDEPAGEPAAEVPAEQAGADEVEQPGMIDRISERVKANLAAIAAKGA